MIIKSLFLKNFRQFTGEQAIHFSTDEDKKVTIIMAESGVGKTTLIQSFQWALYGKCKYTKILNEVTKNNMSSSSEEKVSVKLEINHSNRAYAIERTQVFRKTNIRVNADDSYLTVEYKDEEGVSKQLKGRDAELIIKGLMHQDLFPYFFLEGESLTRVGEQMSRGKNGANNDFVKAIKGLLGFNHLYEAQKHLSMVSTEYNTEIAKNTNDQALRDTIEKITECDKEIHNANDRIITIDREIEYNTQERDNLSERLMMYGEIEEKQKRTKKLTTELAMLDGRIKDRKKQLFKNFSSKGFFLVLNSLAEEARETLKNSDSMDRGIPGMNVDAVKYLLEQKICICGEKLVEGSENWKKLNDLIAYLPPNNIGYELNTFSNELDQIQKQSQYFDEDFIRERKALSGDIIEYNSKVDELHSLNEDIGGVREDIGLLKQHEQTYNQKIVDLNVERRKKEGEIQNLKSQKSVLLSQQETLQKQDAKTQKIQAYYAEAHNLYSRITNFITRKEKEKREKLAQAINDIFADFYEEKITFSLDSNYGVQIKTLDAELSEDFTSGGQDVAVALAFIGAIIKLSGEKDTDPDAVEDEEAKEAYPLIMDAPTSAFGMKQMESFSDIMPKITDQIIVFINDKDGPILMEKMSDNIGEKWSLIKIDTYHSFIEKGVR